MRTWIEYLFYAVIATIVPFLPRSILVPFGRLLGTIYFSLDKRGRRVGRENLRRFLPEANANDVLREGARLQAVALLDALWSRRLNKGRASACLQVSDEATAILRKVETSGTGMVIATAHFGSWEMMNVAGGLLDLPPSTVIAREIDNPYVNRSVLRARERTGNTIVFRDKATLGCLGALKRGEIVCSVIDMAVRPVEGGQFVDFFGTPAMTSSALAFFAHRRRAPLAFAVAVPVRKGLRYRLEVTEIPLDYDADRDVEIPRALREMNRILEGHIRAMPEAWIWNYKRWKWRPGEFAGPYPDYSHWVMSVQ